MFFSIQTLLCGTYLFEIHIFYFGHSSHYFLGSWNSDKQALLQAWPGQSVPNHLGRRHLEAPHGQTIEIDRYQKWKIPELVPVQSCSENKIGAKNKMLH